MITPNTVLSLSLLFFYAHSCYTFFSFRNLGLIIGASVAGGVAVLCLIMVIILCCLQKNNVKKVQIHSDNAGL